MLRDTDDQGFTLAPDIKGGPVPKEEVLENIRQVSKLELPTLKKHLGQGAGTAIFVAGGPTLRDYLDEIRQRSVAGDFIITSNNTYDFLVDNGIIPSACLLLDPKEIVSKYVRKPQPQTQFFVGSVCNVKLFEALRGQSVTRILTCYGLEDESDINLQMELYKNPPARDFLVGGTMTPLRAMPFALLLGYSRLEFYGFDSCYSSKEPPVVYEGDQNYLDALKLNGGMFYKDEDDGRIYTIAEPAEGGFFYAYKKHRGENVTIAQTSDGRKFLTSPGFAHQSKQILKWVERLEGKLEVVIHGDSLSSHLLKLHRDYQAKLARDVGEARWTEKYAEMQRRMHDEKNYGLWGDLDVEFVGRAIVPVYQNIRRPLTVLDYGAGSGALGDELERLFKAASVTRYDPFAPKWRDGPEPGVHDLSNCSDVMEHVEPQCIDNTIKYIADRTRFIATFCIGIEEADKTLPNGENAHITLRSPQWWARKLQKHFVVVEAICNALEAKFVCQKENAKELMEAEMAAHPDNPFKRLAA
jgi:hypothetical protein